VQSKIENQKSKITLVADARIDNRDELLPQLRISQRDISDEDLILHAYERWGEGCAERLLGDFAFIIHDARGDRIFCARDHVGVKPLYYYHAGNIFAAATEIKGLLAVPGIPRQPNEVWIGDYLAGIFNDTAGTFYRDILRLPPAHTLTITRDGARLHRYAALDPDREIRYSSDADYAEAFRELFVEAVRCRLGDRASVGAALSGGLDSSSVACVARDLLAAGGGGPLPTFSVIFEEMKECDERSFIDAVTAGGGMVPHFIHGERVSPLPDPELLLHHLEEPFYAPNLFLHWAMYRSAREQGVRIWLDGLDGDTTVSHGMAFLIELARMGRLLRLGGEVRALAARRPGGSSMRLLRQSVINPLILSPLRARWHRMQGGDRMEWGSRGINVEFARRIGLRERFAALGGGGGRSPRTLREDHLRRLEWGLHTFLLEALGRAAATFGVEPRYPFYDRRLIEFCLALPPDQKLGNGWTRAILRRAMEGILPPAVQWRVGKGNPGPNFFKSLRHYEAASLREIIVERPELIAPYVDLPALRGMYDRYMGSQTRPEEILEIWKALTLGVWLREL
jgi:asparagine synthase (glutamine-hydrolysing)